MSEKTMVQIGLLAIMFALCATFKVWIPAFLCLGWALFLITKKNPKKEQLPQPQNNDLTPICSWARAEKLPMPLTMSVKAHWWQIRA